MTDLDWNDLRFVVAVVRSGSAASAARDLGVSNATVLRRLQALEAQVGAPLFDRLFTGYVPTEAGRRLAEVGLQIESAVIDASRSIDGESTALAGPIRFTTTDSIASELMPELLRSFRDRQPSIRVEMRVTNDRLDLDRRDADVSLRPTSEPPDDWVGMRLVRIDWAVYAAPAWRRPHQEAVWTTLDLLGPAGPLAQHAASQWLMSQVSDASVVASADSLLALRQMVQAGLGAAMLPRFIAEGMGLEVLAQVPPAHSIDLWVLTHQNLRHTARIRVFIEHLAAALRAQRERFEFPGAS